MIEIYNYFYHKTYPKVHPDVIGKCTLSQKHYQTLDDQELTASIIMQHVGWRDMLSTLLQRHHSALLARCYNYLKNHEDAEDAAQETELRVFRAIKKFREDSSFRTWLFAISDRQCYDLVQKRKRHMMDHQLRALIEIHEFSANKITPSTEPYPVVGEVLLQLHEQDRDVIMLRYYMDLPLYEVSSTLNIGLSATKMRLYRALNKFERLLPVLQNMEHV